MTAALTGLGSGALHALAGPDHLVSLAPLSVGRVRGAWAVGLLWGIGHGLGTLLLGALLLGALSQVHLPSLAVWAERAAGLALAGMGVHGLLALRRGLAPAAAPARQAWKALVAIGVLHGATGAAALLLLLPAAASAAPAQQALHLAGFTAGSALAMSALTAGLAAATRFPAMAAVVRRAPALAAGAAILLGVAWVA
jgi:hypothetical protein